MEAQDLYHSTNHHDKASSCTLSIHYTCMRVGGENTEAHIEREKRGGKGRDRGKREGKGG